MICYSSKSTAVICLEKESAGDVLPPPGALDKGEGGVQGDRERLLSPRLSESIGVGIQKGGGGKECEIKIKNQTSTQEK